MNYFESKLTAVKDAENPSAAFRAKIKGENLFVHGRVVRSQWSVVRWQWVVIMLTLEVMTHHHFLEISLQ